MVQYFVMLLCYCRVLLLQEEQLQSSERELAQSQLQIRQKVNCHVTVM